MIDLIEHGKALVKQMIVQVKANFPLVPQMTEAQKQYWRRAMLEGNSISAALTQQAAGGSQATAPNQTAFRAALSLGTVNAVAAGEGAVIRAATATASGQISGGQQQQQQQQLLAGASSTRTAVGPAVGTGIAVHSATSAAAPVSRQQIPAQHSPMQLALSQQQQQQQGSAASTTPAASPASSIPTRSPEFMVID
jgi:hypothetical protein